MGKRYRHRCWIVKWQTTIDALFAELFLFGEMFQDQGKILPLTVEAKVTDNPSPYVSEDKM